MGREATRDALEKIENKVAGSVVSSYTYTVNDLGQRESVATAGSAFGADKPDWGWEYDGLGQIETAEFGGDGVQSGPNDRSYTYDAIGNRKTATQGTAVTSYYDAAPGTPRTLGANSLNQYGRIDYPTDPDAFPVHDAGGNLQSGRLRTIASVGTAATYFIHDGWNLIAEYTGATPALSKAYLRGLDLSNTLQGAGGVGGLLAVRIGTATYYPTFDGNGNASEYLDSNGIVKAHCEYDPFGNITAATGDQEVTNDEEEVIGYIPSVEFAHRFSTKYLDGETGLYYYGFRQYDPRTGRWLSGDPIGERGGRNLYGFVGNDGINLIDKFGLEVAHAPSPQDFQNDLDNLELTLPSSP